MNVSYSKLAKLAVHPQEYLKYIEDKQISSPQMIFGSLVDCLLTEPEKLEQLFHIMDIEITASDKVKDIVEDIYNQFQNEVPFNKIDKKDIVDTARAYEYQNKWGDDTIYKYLVKEGQQYYEYLGEVDKADTDGKDIISSDQLLLAQKYVEILKNHFLSKELINPSMGGVIYQPKIEYSVDGVNMRCKPDMVHEGRVWEINGKTHMEINITDLKVVSYPASEFLRSFYKFKYFLQAPIYIDAAYNRYKDSPHELHINFIFLVIGSDLKPLPYRMSLGALQIYAGGGVSPTGRTIKGYRQYIEELKWHVENDLWEYPYDVYKDKGIIIDI